MVVEVGEMIIHKGKMTKFTKNLALGLVTNMRGLKMFFPWCGELLVKSFSKNSRLRRGNKGIGGRRSRKLGLRVNCIRIGRMVKRIKTKGASY